MDEFQAVQQRLNCNMVSYVPSKTVLIVGSVHVIMCSVTSAYVIAFAGGCDH